MMANRIAPRTPPNPDMDRTGAFAPAAHVHVGWSERRLNHPSGAQSSHPLPVQSPLMGTRGASFLPSAGPVDDGHRRLLRSPRHAPMVPCSSVASNVHAPVVPLRAPDSAYVPRRRVATREPLRVRSVAEPGGDALRPFGSNVATTVSVAPRDGVHAFIRNILTVVSQWRLIMAKCPVCHGSGKCKTCNGTGSGKSNNTHPSQPLVNPNTGSVRCLACNGSTCCVQCSGSGQVR